MKLSRISKKQWIIIGICGLLVPFWLFIVGGYITYRLYRSKLNKKLRYSLVALSAILTLSLGSQWAGASLNNNESKQTESSSQNNNKQQDATYVANQNSEVNTLTPEPTTTPSPEPEKYTKYTVSEVIDGDTIKLSTGKKLRYIGIDTPETKHPSVPLECYGKEASAKNNELVSGKEVRLEKDVSETDKYGRLLRYVYVGDIFVNDYLVRQGFAKASSYPPDIKHQEQFREAEKEARENKRGLWSGVCDKPTTLAPKSQSKPVSKSTDNNAPSITSQTNSYICDCNKLCGQMSSCDEAYYQLNQCGCSKRDGNSDGVPCESICK